MTNRKFSFTARYAVLAAIAIAVGVFSMYGGDLSKNLKTAVIGDYGYTSNPINYQARNFACYPGPIQPNDGSKYAGTYNTYMFNYGEAYANSGVKGTWCTPYLPTGDSTLFDDPPLKTSTTNTPTDHTTGYINAGVYKVTDANGNEDLTNPMYRRWQEHVKRAQIHENRVVFYENTLPGYGTYYTTGYSSGGNASPDPAGSGLYGNSVVHCPTGAVVVDHTTTASPYKATSSTRHYLSSPTDENGLYDGSGHKWCELSGVAVNPVLGPETGKSMPDFASDKSSLYKFTFPTGDFYKFFNPWSNYTGASMNSDWVKCDYGVAGPFVEGINQHYISPYDSTSNQNKQKAPHYHCLSQSGASYVEPVKNTVGPPSSFNTWTFLSGIMYSENTCNAGDSTCGGAGTVGAPAPCSRGTYYYQTTDANYRRCLTSSTAASDTFNPPAPSWTISAPTNPRITGTKTTGFALTESVPVAADFAATGTGIPYGQATLTVQIAQDTSFATAWVRPSSTGSVTAIGSSVNSYIDNFPASGIFYWRAKMALGTQESSWTSAPYGSFVVCATGKTWNGTGCITPTVATCALDIKLNDGKNPYNKGDMVNYTYSCTPAGTKAASVTVQVVKPDGTATTYNTGTNIDTATLGFSTSNLEPGSYILRACLNSTCTSGVASANFTVAPTTTTTTTTTAGPTLTGTIFKDGQYVDPVTFTLRNCVSPNAWMKEGATTSGARGFHCMPNYTATSYDYPPSSCTGTLWAGYSGGSSTTAVAPDYCATSKDSIGSDIGTIPSDWKQIIWNDLGLKSYVSINTPQSIIDAAKKACAKTKLENATWPNPTDFSKPDTVGVPSCNGSTNVTVTDNTPRQCATGETCPSGSWCNNGKQCYYPDGKLTCVAWTMGGSNNCADVVPGTKECSPTDTNCIEPGATGPVSGWCKNSMDCFTADGLQKLCQPYSNEPMKATSCPAGSKLCGANDPKCIEPGATGAIDGWCKNAMECYSKDGTEKYCQSWSPATTNSTNGTATMTTMMSCPAAYPKSCRPNEKNCTEIGETNSNSGAWCSGGGKQCFKGDGSLYCAKQDESCPKDSKACPPNSPNCIEPDQEGPTDGWCGGMGSIQCYKSDGKTKKCVSVPSMDPFSWETASCPTGSNRCAPNSPGCLGYIGAKGKQGDWCAVGMTKSNADGTITCVSMKDMKLPTPGPLPVPAPDKDVCIQVLATAYDPATGNCKTFATPCNIPADWTKVTDGRVCQDGKLGNLNEMGGDDASFKKILEEKSRYLNDMELRLITLPSYVSGIEPVKVLIHDAMVTIKGIYQYFPTKTESNRKLVRDKINSLMKDTIPIIETQMNSLNVYINFNSLSGEVRRDLERYKMILKGSDSTDYYKKLKDGVSKLESLVESAKSVTNSDALQQLVVVIKAQWRDLQDLESGHRDNKGNEFLQKNVDDLVDALDRFESLVSEKNITDPKIIALIDRFKTIVEQVSDIGDFNAEENQVVIRLVDEGTRLKVRLDGWLVPYGLEQKAREVFSIDQLVDLVDARMTEKLNAVFDKLQNKMQVMLDETLKEVTAKLTEFAQVALDRFSKDFTDKVAQNLNNLVSVNSKQKTELSDSTNRILDRTQAVVESIDKSDLSSASKQSFSDVMEKIATHVWCGEYAEKIQAELSSKGLALEAGELDAAKVSAFDKEVNDWINGNQKECYKVGATPGLDVPMESWYHPYISYNRDHGYMNGYGGNRAGQFGPGNVTLRIEALKMIMRLLNIPEGDTATLETPQPGVPDWGIGYVNGAKGFLDKSWNMAQPITRAEAAKLFVAAMTYGDNAYITMPTVIDQAKNYTDYSKFAGDKNTALAIEAMTDAGIFKGAGDGGFHPYDNLLRSEFSATNQRVAETYSVAATTEPQQ